MYYIATDHESLADEERPNSIQPERPVPRPAPQKEMPESDKYPVLLSGRIHGGDVHLSWCGADRIYQIRAHTERVSQLAPGALVMVRISKALPSHAEIFEPGTVNHRFLGHALFRAARPA